MSTPDALVRSGTYHDNYLMPEDGYVLRVRKRPGERDVEPRMFAEKSVLAALEPAAIPAPRFLGERENALVISYLPGVSVSEIYPPGAAIPNSFPSFIAGTMRDLYQVRHPAEVLADSPWTGTEDTAGFLRGLLGWLTEVFDSASPEEKACLRAVGLPERPFDPGNFPSCDSRRPLRLCHGDLQRSNVLAAPDGRYWLLDWELAVWGDPLWDIASHLHRAAYPAAQVSSALFACLASCLGWSGSSVEQKEYDAYLRIEQYRSLVLDCVRNLRLGGTWDEQTRLGEVATYCRKLSAAGIGERSESEIRHLFEACWRQRR